MCEREVGCIPKTENAAENHGSWFISQSISHQVIIQNVVAIPIQCTYVPRALVWLSVGVHVSIANRELTKGYVVNAKPAGASAG